MLIKKKYIKAFKITLFLQCIIDTSLINNKDNVKHSI